MAVAFVWPPGPRQLTQLNVGWLQGGPLRRLQVMQLRMTRLQGMQLQVMQLQMTRLQGMQLQVTRLQGAWG